MNDKHVIGPHRVALITGGSSGIGLAAARHLARKGNHLWLLARDPGRLNKAMDVLEGDRISSDQQFHTAETDVSDSDQVLDVMERIQSESGTPHLVINSAGQTYPGYIEAIDLKIFHQLMDVNYFGSVYITKAVLPKMLERGWGHIVFISSLGGLIPAFGYTAYCASKFALHGFVDSLRQEVEPTGINLSLVCPADTDTPQLAYENKFKPKETRMLAKFTCVVSPEYVAGQMLSGVSRGKYLIIPGMDSKLVYLLKRMLGRGFDKGMDLLIAMSRRNGSSSSS